MKVPIDDCHVIDLDAPVLPVYQVRVNGGVRWIVWCKYCHIWHWHSLAEGHREAHCNDSNSPYWKTGYNLAYDGKAAFLKGEE